LSAAAESLLSAQPAADCWARKAVEAMKGFLTAPA
jgi:hypothetical protein